MKRLVIALSLGMLIGSSAVTFAANSGEVSAVFASFNLKINGQDKQLETTPLVYNGTSYLPVREIANLVGYDVTYKADSRTIELSSVTSDAYGPNTPTTPIPSVIQKPPFIEPKSQEINKNALMRGRDLVNVLAEKYPDKSDSIRLISNKDILSFDGKNYHLLYDETLVKYDITPLIETGILNETDIGYTFQ